MSSTLLTEQEFKSWTDDLQYIIFDCHISLANHKALYYYLYEGPEWRPIVGFLDHLRTQYYFTLVTQLAKVFCEGSQHLRLSALISRIGMRPVQDFIVQQFEYNKTDVRRKRLPQFWKNEEEMRSGLKEINAKIKVCSPMVSRLKKCRNQVVAHTDHQHLRGMAERNAPSVDELESLVRTAAEVYNAIMAGLSMGSFSFDTTRSWDIEGIFRGWKGFLELHKVKGQVMRMEGVGIIRMDRASGKLTVEPLP